MLYATHHSIYKRLLAVIHAIFSSFGYITRRLLQNNVSHTEDEPDNQNIAQKWKSNKISIDAIDCGKPDSETPLISIRLQVYVLFHIPLRSLTQARFLSTK